MTASAPPSGAASGRTGEGTRALSWETFASTYLPAMILSLGAGMALPAIPVLAKSFDVTFGQASFVITAFLIGGMVGTLPTGWVIDRFGRRSVMISGPLLTAFMAALVVIAHSFPELLVYRFIDGMAAQMWLLGRLAGISHRASPDQRGRQVSWMYGMDNLGRLSGPLAGGFIAAAWGERSPFAAYALLALLAMIPTVLLAEDTPTRRSAANGEPEKRGSISIRHMVLSRLPFFGIAFFSSMARGPLFGNALHLYAAFAYNLDAREIGMLATAASVVGLPVGFTAGWIMDRFGRKATMVPGFIAVTLSMAALGIVAALQLSVGWYVAGFLITVMTQSMTSGSVQTIGADVAPPEARGLFLGVWRFTSQIGTSTSPMIFALLADAAGYGSGFLYAAGTALIVAVLLIFKIPETSNRRVPTHV